ncbi:NAD-binding protein, partial [Candidatus Woesearchaeota archaeon]|nr:NAD-binding protein [Candidatus Woesearchaeota archaeon]
LFAAVFNIIGLSIVIGAFIAGVALGNLEYNIEIISRIKPLKDFFATIFFASLGLQLSITALKDIWLPLIIFVLFITFIKPVITQILCSLFGYKKKVGFLSGLCLSQTSEFSLIIISTGLVLGHVTQSIFGLVILIAIITMVLTTYKVQYDHQLYRKLARHLGIFEKLMPVKHGLEYIKEERHDVVLCGYNRIGSLVYNTLKKLKKDILVIDYNPEVIKKLMNRKIHCIYGDVGDIEIIERMNLKKATMLISTVPETATNLLLIKKAKEYNPSIIVLVRESQIDDALALYDQGADYVILPHIIGGEHVSVLLEKFGKVENIVKRKIQHIMELKKHKES